MKSTVVANDDSFMGEDLRMAFVLSAVPLRTLLSFCFRKLNLLLVQGDERRASPRLYLRDPIRKGIRKAKKKIRQQKAKNSRTSVLLLSFCPPCADFSSSVDRFEWNALDLSCESLIGKFS